MATYKVLQDIEAEDKLLGPLTLRQFIYAIIVVVFGFIAFQLARAVWFLAIPFLPPMIFFGLLAAPIGQNQSSEVWLLAKIRYFLFPRRRIWDQTGLQELVTITVPKKIENNFDKGFSKEEVTSRLKALANTLDSRGWAIKNVSPAVLQTASVFGQTGSDRLIDIGNLPTSQPELVAKASDDVLDTNTNPVAQQMNQMIQKSESTHRQELLERVHQLAAEQPATSTMPAQNPPAPKPVESSRSIATPNAVVHPVAPTQPVEAFVPQPIINNAGDVVHKPEVAQVADLPKNNPPQKAVSTMTTPANTGILSDVKDTAPQSVTVHHDESGNGASDNDEVVISLR